MMWIPLVLVLVVAYYFLKSESFSKGNQSPEELLKERFVKGEIDEATYLQMKATLNK